MKTFYRSEELYVRLRWLLLLLVLFPVVLVAQVGINTDGSEPNQSAGLDVKFSDKGFLPPRLSQQERDAIDAPAAGLIIFNTTTKSINLYDGMEWYALGRETPALTDVDGNVYPVVKIGTKTWMARNLRAVHNADGSPIVNAMAYNNDTSEVSTYGLLYNWTSMMNQGASSNLNPSGVQGICPNGWHLPSENEWLELLGYYGGDSTAGGALRDSGYFHWSEPNTGASNVSGLTLLPGGYGVLASGQLIFEGKHFNGNYWSCTEYDTWRSWDFSFYYDFAGVYHVTNNKGMNLSVRCVKD